MEKVDLNVAHTVSFIVINNVPDLFVCATNIIRLDQLGNDYRLLSPGVLTQLHRARLGIVIGIALGIVLIIVLIIVLVIVLGTLLLRRLLSWPLKSKMISLLSPCSDVVWRFSFLFLRGIDRFKFILLLTSISF